MYYKNTKNADAFPAAIIFLAVLGLYIATAAPGLLFEDTGEFAVSAATLGVSHPPGYPLYLLLAHLFSWLPVTGTAFCVTLFSCVAGAAGCCIVFAAARLLGISRIASCIAAVLLGVSRTLWSQCAIQEVYALGVLLAAALLYVVIRMYREDSPRLLPVAALLLALNFLNHYIVFIAYAPVVLGFFVVFLIRRRLAPAHAAATVLIFISIASLTVYLPLRAAANPAIFWGDPDTFLGFLRHLMRSQFLLWENQIRFYMPTKWAYIADLTHGLAREFSFPFVFAALMGLFMMPFERRRLFWFLGYLFAAQTIGIIIFINFHFEPHFIFIFQVFYINAYIIFALFAAYGMDGVLAGIARSVKTSWAPRAIALALPLLLAWTVCQNLPYNQWLFENRSLRFGRDAFRVMRRDAVFFIEGVLHDPPIGYLYIATNFRNDVHLIDSHGTMLRGNFKTFGHTFNRMDMPEIYKDIVAQSHNTRPVYMASELFSDMIDQPTLVLGPVYKVNAVNACDLSLWEGNNGLFPPAKGIIPPYYKTTDYNSDYLTVLIAGRRARCEFLEGRKELAESRLVSLGRVTRGQPLPAMQIGYIIQRFGGKPELAEQWYKQALKYCPTFSDAYVQLGLFYAMRGDTGKARGMFERALYFTPRKTDALNNLAIMDQEQYEYAKAISRYKKVMELEPEAALPWNNLGNVYESMERWADAERCYKKAIKLSPSMAITYYNIGKFYLMRGRQFDGIHFLTQYVDKAPGDIHGLYELGVAYEDFGDYNSAIDVFRRVVDKEPGSVQAWDRYVSVLMKLGKVRDIQDNIKTMRALADKLKRQPLKDYADKLEEQLKRSQ